MHRRAASVMMALTGLVLFLAFVNQDVAVNPDRDWSNLPWGLILRYAVAMTLGGAFAGYLFSGLFGRDGILGWLLAIAAGLVTTLFAGLFGSAFGDLPDMAADGISTTDLIRISAGLLIMPLSVASAPLLAVVFAALIAATHLICRKKRSAEAL